MKREQSSADYAELPEAHLAPVRGGRGRVTIRIGGAPTTVADQRDIVLQPPDVKRLLRSGAILGHILRYQAARITVDDFGTVLSPAALLMTRALSNGDCWVEDRFGVRHDLTWSKVAATACSVGTTLFRAPALLHRVDRAIDRLAAARRIESPARFDSRARPVYLRTDYCFGLQAGGSVGHTAGVINNLDAFAGPVCFICPDPIPTVREDIETIIVRPERRPWLRSEWAQLDFNRKIVEKATHVLSRIQVAFLYHRYSLHSYAALELAQRLKVPLILEYNGSEVWVAQHWGQPLKDARRAALIEMLNLRGADLVTVVSEALRDELVGRGIAPGKILVNPNGVDPRAFSPIIDGTRIRRRFGLEDDVVIGFIGTFGRWHGAEVLAEAFGRFLAGYDKERPRLRLLMIGDGTTMPEVRDVLQRFSAVESTVMTGIVPQSEAPRYLAACDILVAPHVPTPDGSTFFGSPTKLFEYMAMGKGIVASKLGQIGDVIVDGRNGLLVPPGDVGSLAAALHRLVSDPSLAQRLGRRARADVLARFTWRAHVARIFDRLPTQDSWRPS